MPLAFFCTLFFRHRKKSVSAPWDGKSQFAPESARQAPLGAGLCACGRTGGFPLAPLHPLRIATRSNRVPHRAASPSPAPESARQAPPKGNCLRQSCLLLLQAGGFPLAPCTPSGRSWRKNQRGINIPTESAGGFRTSPCTPFGPHSARKMRGKQSGKKVGAFLKTNNPRADGSMVCACGRTGGFPQSQPSARPALPCTSPAICGNE